MSTRRRIASIVGALLFAIAGVAGSVAPAAASTSGYAGFKSSGWVDCGDGWTYTSIEGAIDWRETATTVPWYGTEWYVSPISDMVEINDPGLIREYCGPYNYSRYFDLKNDNGQIVASNQTAYGEGSASCFTWQTDPNFWTLAQGCNTTTYVFYYMHPAGYIRYGGSVFPRYYGGGWTGSTGWVSMGG